MSERDELIAIAMEEATDNGIYMGAVTAEDIADAALAWGFHKPRTVVTIEDLNALENTAIILDDLCIPFRKDKKRNEYWAMGSTGTFSPLVIQLPATVLYEPRP